jgi:hypothetical protein
MVKKNFVLFFLALIFITSTGYVSTAQAPTFEETLKEWLDQKGFHGDILEVQRNYDDDGFIDHFLLRARENKLGQNDRTKPEIDVEVTNDGSGEAMTVKLLDKDVKGISFMISDWVAYLVVRFALNEISNVLGLPMTIRNQGDLRIATFSPSSTSTPSRYRFDELTVTYQVQDLIANLEVTLRGPQNYLVMEFVRNFINSAVRALENGHFPGSSTTGVGSFDSNSLIQKFLRLDEASQKLPEAIQEMSLRPNSEQIP